MNTAVLDDYPLDPIDFCSLLHPQWGGLVINMITDTIVVESKLARSNQLVQVNKPGIRERRGGYYE